MRRCINYAAKSTAVRLGLEELTSPDPSVGPEAKSVYMGRLIVGQCPMSPHDKVGLSILLATAANRLFVISSKADLKT
jgi:hypothetical protein